MAVGGEPGSQFAGIPGDGGDPTVYTLPAGDGGEQEHLHWGAWCTFCHELASHPGVVEADACQGSHMHGGNNF